MPSFTMVGEKLRARLTEMAQNLDKAHKVRVGFLEGATYPDGTSVPLVAAINEFGAPSRGQPPRPFFRRMIKQNEGDWGESLAQLLVVTNYDAKAALELLGADIAGQLRQSIIDLTEPALAQSTIDRKGFDKPLISTGHMLQSVDHEVE